MLVVILIVIIFAVLISFLVYFPGRTIPSTQTSSAPVVISDSPTFYTIVSHVSSSPSHNIGTPSQNSLLPHAYSVKVLTFITSSICTTLE